MENNGKEVKSLQDLFKENLAKFDMEDSGRVGKAFEITLRYAVQPNSSRTGVTHQFAWYGDMKKMLEKGKYSNFEIKSSCGELGIIDSSDYQISQILPKADYVIYAPEVVENVNVDEQAFVFTRDEFLEMISSYTGKGQILRTKTATNGGLRLSFQSFYSETRKKASKKIANYLWDCCYNQPTVKEFFS